MPVAKIHVLKGQYNEARLGKVSAKYRVQCKTGLLAH